MVTYIVKKVGPRMEPWGVQKKGTNVETVRDLQKPV